VLLGTFICGQALGRASTGNSSGTNATDIAGTWQETMQTQYGLNLHAILKIARDQSGKLSAMLYNIDNIGPPMDGDSGHFEAGTL
jgi:hypothetical protein